MFGFMIVLNIIGLATQDKYSLIMIVIVSS